MRPPGLLAGSDPPEEEPAEQWSAPVRIGLVTVGFLAFAAGAVAVFLSDNAVGTAALIAAGVVLIMLGLLGHRIRSIEGAGMRFNLQQAVEETFQAAEDAYRASERAEQQGEHDVATQLRDEAEDLLSAARIVSAKFEQVRARQPSSWERTRQLEEVMQQARRTASGMRTREGVTRLFRLGGDGDRLSALAMVQDDPKLASTALVSEAIVDARSSFEQYQALKAAERMAEEGLSPAEAATLREALDSALASEAFPYDSDRSRKARRIRDLLDAGPPTRGG